MFLRIFSILNIIFLIFIACALIANGHFNEKIKANEKLIEADKEMLKSLEALVTRENEEYENNENKNGFQLFQNKSFAGYDEVIPFIALLEGIFSSIDPDAKITMQNKEVEISSNHYADYNINLRINNKQNLLLKALDEIHNSRFITKISNFNVRYNTPLIQSVSEISDVSFTMRLFLN